MQQNNGLIQAKGRPQRVVHSRLKSLAGKQQTLRAVTLPPDPPINVESNATIDTINQPPEDSCSIPQPAVSPPLSPPSLTVLYEYFTRYGQYLSMRAKRLLATMIVDKLVLLESPPTRPDMPSPPPPPFVAAPAIRRLSYNRVNACCYSIGCYPSVVFCSHVRRR
ncbi:hypothetical protein J6590_055084 [Homalodisca vitripennis]|nr:hypothetical protein J6590_055084 [Homalodisca vitripennis]